MKSKDKLVLTKELLKKDISQYSSFFKKIEPKEAREKGLSFRFNYFYEGKPLFFAKHKINNLAVRVKNNQIIKIYFEIYYSDKIIFQNLIDEFGYPDVGHVNPNLPYLKNSKKSRKNKDNYIYENYTGLTWTKNNEDTFIHITNLQNNNYFIDKKSKLWVSFNIVK